MWLNPDSRSVGIYVLCVLTANSLSAVEVDTSVPRYGAIALALIDDEHTRDDGRNSAGLYISKDRGDVAGQSSRYRDFQENGQSPFYFDAATGSVTKIGLDGPSYRNDDDYRYSRALKINNIGHVAGVASRYDTQPGSQDVWLYDHRNGSTTVLGLTDAEHTSTLGTTLSDIRDMNDAGQIIGYSQRYREAENIGTTTWLYDPGIDTYRVLGLTGSEYTDAMGLRSSVAGFLGENLVSGSSMRFDGVNPLGQILWIYDTINDTTSILGLSDAEHTRNDGSQDEHLSTVRGQWLLGESTRYYEDEENGTSLWTYNLQTKQTTRIGLIDVEHTLEPAGRRFQSSHFGQMNGRGQILGRSERFIEQRGNGQTAWVYDTASGTTVRLGLTDVEHRTDDGYDSNTATFINERGDIVGFAEQFVNGRRGQSAWHYDPITNETTQIGLYDEEHTVEVGYNDNNANVLNEQGFALGTATHRSGGRSIWLFDANTQKTSRLGITDGDHTAANDEQNSEAWLMNSSGQVAGMSIRYVGGYGRSAWLYDQQDDVIKRLGLFDGAHTSDTGMQSSYVSLLNENGQTAGTSMRFGSDQSNNLSGWYYDLESDTVYELVSSERSSDSYSRTLPQVLTNDGKVLGVYLRFDPEFEDEEGDSRGFLWDPVAGFHDFADLTEGQIDRIGLDGIREILSINENGLIRGLGWDAESRNEIEFAMYVVPEPGIPCMLCLIVWCGIRSRCLLSNPQVTCYTGGR